MVKIQINEIIINGYYENIKNGEIVRVDKFTNGDITYFNDIKSKTKKESEFVESYKYRKEINDFPNAKDPKLPYVFDLNYDIKYTSDLLRLLRNDKTDESELMELIKTYEVYKNNLEVKKIYDKYVNNVKNYIKKIKSIIYEEIDLENIKFTLKVEKYPEKEPIVLELKKEENGTIEYLNNKAKFTEEKLEIRSDYNKTLNFIQKIINQKKKNTMNESIEKDSLNKTKNKI